ncbi:MAG: hypothetical protein EOP10_00435 [Proteobacteria bacterium]|nr:MAG: hypothetical protein EOP10_00435 [Pseudomonadota bacterium]
MAKVLSPVSAISNLSELTGLGRTSSITLPKRRYWKQISLSAFTFVVLSLACTFAATSDFLSNDESAEDSFGNIQIVPAAPNPEKIPLEFRSQEAVSEAPVMVEPPAPAPSKIKAKPTLKLKSAKVKATRTSPTGKHTQKMFTQTKKTSKAQP